MFAAAALTAAALASAVPVGVGAREYRFGVYRPSVPRGVVKLNVHNYGEDDHNLLVRGPRGWLSQVSPDVKPGENLAFVVRLPRKGVYTLLCVKGDHAKRGMRAILRVR